jgi:hypothetical protein
MIKFQTIRFKNILSYGNQVTEIRLDKSPTTLISGKNGSGKCLDKSTEIEIEIDDPHILELFEQFIK